MSIIDKVRRNLELAKRCFGFNRLKAEWELAPPERRGLCYVLAWRYLIDLGEEEAVLVHGKVWSHHLGKMIDHAWVEINGYVWEPTFNILVKKEDFYREFRAEPEAKYSYKEALALAVKHKHYGPWHKSL